MDLGSLADSTGQVFIFADHLFFLVANGVVLSLLLLLSAFVSGSEVAFFSISQEQLTTLKNSADKRERGVYNLLSEPKKLLATILVLNNFVNVAFVTISTFVTWRLIGGNEASGLVVVLQTVVVTFLIVFFGEIIPKIYSNQKSLVFAKASFQLIRIGGFLAQPLSYLLVRFGSLIDRRIQKKGYKISVDEIHEALEMTAGKETTEEEKEILRGIVNFGTISTKQIMRPRQDIVAADIEMGFPDMLRHINEHGYSRVPVYRETIDKIEGVLYIKDLLPHLEQDKNFSWQSLLRPGYFVPENKKIDDLLKDFQEKRVHMAIVVDEYGGTSGMITMEDIIEEIVGEIHDEFDEKEGPDYSKLDEKTYIFDAKTMIADFCEIVQLDERMFDEVRGEAESIAGLLLELFSRMPKIGEFAQHDRVKFTVLALDNKRIKKVKIEIDL